ncbi:MAG: hypothetical protein HYY32_01880 [Chloroflexi bacterium]|nr:hypothetical protein [Chloroflexota bacterium]
MKAFRISALAILLIGLLAAGACGAPPAGAAGKPPSSKELNWDYKYPGKLDSEQQAIAAVLALLESEAKSDSSRLYLAEYKLVARNRVSVQSDDKETWYVTLTMDRKPDSEQGEKPYWQSSAWMVFKDGKVLPSSRHGGNAARILTDLRGASS